MNYSEDEPLEHKINKETARIHWSELQTHFAAGNLVVVSHEIDLIHAAKCIADDDTQTIQQWMEAGAIAPASDSQAIEWEKSNEELWAVVIKPWILVQEVQCNKQSNEGV